MTPPRALRWVVVGNIADSGNSPFRRNARVVVIDTTQGVDGPRTRIEVRGLSFGGRRVRHWIGVRQLTDIRVAREHVTPWWGYELREHAQVAVDSLVTAQSKTDTEFVKAVRKLQGART